MLRLIPPFLVALLFSAAPVWAAEPAGVDRYGDPLPPRAIARLGGNRLRHVGGVFPRLTYSPDGRFLAFSGGPRVYVWEARSGRLLQLLTGHKGELSGMAVSPDGKVIATGGEEGIVRLWQVRNGRLLRHWKGHAGWITTLAFSPDGRTLAAGRTEWGTGLPRFHVDLWDLETRKTRATLAAKRGATDLAFAPDGRTLAATCGECLLVWDLATEEPIFQHQSDKRHIQGLAFSPDGRLLATAHNDRTVRLWRTRDWKEQVAFNWRIGDVLCVAFAPDGMTAAAGGRSGRIVLWDVDL